MGNIVRGLLLGAACAVCCASVLMAASASNSPRLWVERFAQPLHADYLSPEHEVPGGFTSAVLSWNAQTPGGSWLNLQLRARVGGRWTTWYQMGHWSADFSHGHRRSVAKKADADGRVDTDTLYLHSRADAAQARAQLHAASAAEPPALTLIAVTTDASPGSASSSQAWGEDINVPQRTQRVMESPDGLGGGGDAWCSPTSVSMVMGYWAAQLHHPQWDADVPTSAKGTYDPVYDGCGNWPFNVAYASEHGLAGWVERLGNLHDIERYIARGVPVIASIKAAAGEIDGTPYKSSDGHLLVVRGFTPQGDVIVNDPYGLPGSIRRTYNRSEFAHVWLHGSGGIVYIIGPPGLLQELR